jgi:nucleotide-binding universal stress UspA family protein
MSFETIVIATDGSEDAQRALEEASELATATDGVVHVVCAHDPSPPHEVVEALKHVPRDYWTSYDPATAQQQVLDKAASALAENGVKHVEHLVQKHPAHAILDVADEVDADLIVMGSRGTGWATRLTRGSISTRVAAHSSRNILIVHA